MTGAEDRLNRSVPVSVGDAIAYMATSRVAQVNSFHVHVQNLPTGAQSGRPGIFLERFRTGARKNTNNTYMTGLPGQSA